MDHQSLQRLFLDIVTSGFVNLLASFPDSVCILIFVSVAKPLVNDGSTKSHELSLAYDQYSLRKLEPPLVLQEFVNHGIGLCNM